MDSDGDIRVVLQAPKPSPSPCSGKNPPTDTNLETPISEATTIELTISSKMLCMASPVFRVMFRPGSNFKEAIEFAKKKASAEPYILSLPDDDAEAVTLLLQIIHFDFDKIPDRPSPACLEKLAFVCDKYQCTPVLRHCGTIWLRDWLAEHGGDSYPPVEELCQVLVFAYVFDLAKEFTAAAWKLVLVHKGPLGGKLSQARLLHDHPLPTDHIDTQRFAFCHTYHTALMTPINQPWETMGKPCFRAAKAVGTYLHALRTAGVMPHDLDFSNHNLDQLLLQDKDLPAVPMKTYSCTVWNCPCAVDLNAPHANDLMSPLRVALARLQTRGAGFVCLDCIKTEEASRAEGRCRLGVHA